MNTTTRQSTTNVRVGQGAAVHARHATAGDGYTACGSEGRTPGASRLHATDDAVTCRRCIVLVPAAPDPVEAPTTRQARTWDATTAETHVCAGACGQTLPAKSFPTTGTPGRRGVVCRKDRDATKEAS